MKSKLILTTVIAAIGCLVNAGPKKAHRHHEAHVHGGGKLQIAFEGGKGRIEYRSAAEAVLGFEHEPNSPSEKKQMEQAQAAFSAMDKLVQFPVEISCKFSPEKIARMSEKESEQSPGKGKKHHGQHSDFVVQFSVSCAKPPVGLKLRIDFTQFPRLKDLDIVFLGDNVQTSAEYKGKALEIFLGNP